MGIFLSVFGFLGISIGVILLILALFKKTSKRNSSIIIAISLVLFIVGATNSGTKNTKSADSKPAAQTEKKKEISWKEEINKIAKLNGSPTEKYDAVMIFAKDYQTNEKEVKGFTKEILKEYKTKKYDADITNDQYMLTNIFKANVINRYIGKVNTPQNDFAFDFYQNTKYLYRGVDKTGSDAVRANERQMEKALKSL